MNKVVSIIALFCPLIHLYGMENMEELVATTHTYNLQLIHCIKGNDPEGVRYALEHGADANIRMGDYNHLKKEKEKYGPSPIGLAVLEGQLKIVRLLLDHGSDFTTGRIYKGSGNYIGDNILDLALKKHFFDIGRLLYMYGHPKIRGNWQKTFYSSLISWSGDSVNDVLIPEPLAKAAGMPDDNKVNAILVEQNPSAKEKRLALAFAAGQGNESTVHLLLNANTDPINAFHIVVGILRRKSLGNEKAKYQRILDTLALPALKALAHNLREIENSKLYNLPKEIIAILLSYVIGRPMQFV